MAAAVIPLIIASTVVTAVGQIKQGQQQFAAAEFNARVAEEQANAIRSSASFEEGVLERKSDLEQSKIAREKKLFISSQRAAFAKGGVRLDEGTPLFVIADTAAQFELESATERFNLRTGLERSRFETRVGVAKSKSTAAFQRLLGRTKRTAAFFRAGTTILSGGAKIAPFFPSKSKED